MTILRMYSVRDQKSQTFGFPFRAVNDATALRSVSMEVNSSDETSVLHTNPADFDLYYVGDFCDNSGAFIAADQPEFLVNLLSLLTQPGLISNNQVGTADSQEV